MDQTNINPSEQNTNPQPVLSTIPSNLPTKSNSFLKIIIVILLIIFLGLGVFLGKTYFSPQALPQQITSVPTLAPTAIPTADPTVDWKTYTDSKGLFSFKYPSNLVEEKKTIEATGASFRNNEYLFDLLINYDISSYTSMVDSIKKQVTSKDFSANIINIEPFTAYLDSVQSAGGDYSFSRTVIIPMQNDLVVFILRPKDQNKSSETEKLADQILSTFKFLDQTKTTETENWKTFTSDKFKYSLKYPANWIFSYEAKDFGQSTGILSPEYQKAMESGENYLEKSSIGIIVENIGNKTIDKYMDEINTSTGVKNNINYKYENEIIIDSQRGILTKGGCCGRFGYHIFVKSNGNLYIFSLTGDYRNNKVFDQILSTFKFTQ